MLRYDIDLGVKRIKTKFDASKKLLLLIAFALPAMMVLTFVTVGAASSPNPAGKSAPKATGGVGYTAYTDVQRHADFSAIQGDTNCARSLVGNYVFTLNYGGNVYAHDINISSQTGNTFSGTGGYPSTGPYAINEIVTGSITGNNFTLNANYSGTTYVYTVNGTINADGTLTAVNWSDTSGQSGGNQWTITGNASVLGCTGKGNLSYTDASGYWYNVDVRYVKVSGDKTWFAGLVTEGNVGVGSWLFEEVQDVGTPGSSGDKIWGSFTTENAAKLGVATMTNPSDGAFVVTSGNLVVHNSN